MRFSSFSADDDELACVDDWFGSVRRPEVHGGAGRRGKTLLGLTHHHSKSEKELEDSKGSKKFKKKTIIFNKKIKKWECWGGPPWNGCKPSME